MILTIHKQSIFPDTMSRFCFQTFLFEWMLKVVHGKSNVMQIAREIKLESR